ncbi:dGTP triphosphohydrolase [Herbaspirillum huttiense]|uniref:dGTP triphosphohydrolase n=1 Tax=Herbaspirillum huttiense TaxID=863372 RepID=UPI0031D47928
MTTKKYEVSQGMGEGGASLTMHTVVELYREQDFQRATPRLVVAEGESGRSAFRRDYARLVHSPSFRRLQGKTQLFPGVESDFFRNRLTHSLEVAQIAKAIALRLNSTNDYFRQFPLDTDLVETAALAHDLGHPPFGHNGEYALDERMRRYGGFEGNAQTLHIVASLEKKELRDGVSGGLNFTARTLCALLKYDKKIPEKRAANNSTLLKGYYESESELIADAKRKVLGGAELGKAFKTIECDIMDTADDIAYSTYDLEDALKAGFVTPLDVLDYAHDKTFLAKIAEKVAVEGGITIEEVNHIFVGTFGKFIVENFQGATGENVDLIGRVVDTYRASKKIASDGYLRTALTSALVNEFISGVNAEINEEQPALSKVSIAPEVKKRIEVLKHFTYEALIMSPRLKIVEYRGQDIVKAIFDALADEERKGYLLLPDDYRQQYAGLQHDKQRKRLICDFIAGMTDRYAVEFYSRLLSTEQALSFFKPI